MSIYLGTIQRSLPKGWIEGSIDNISGAVSRASRQMRCRLATLTDRRPLPVNCRSLGCSRDKDLRGPTSGACRQRAQCQPTAQACPWSAHADESPLVDSQPLYHASPSPRPPGVENAKRIHMLDSGIRRVALVALCGATIADLASSSAATATTARRTPSCIPLAGPTSSSTLMRAATSRARQLPPATRRWAT